MYLQVISNAQFYPLVVKSACGSSSQFCKSIEKVLGHSPLIAGPNLEIPSSSAVRYYNMLSVHHSGSVSFTEMGRARVGLHSLFCTPCLAGFCETTMQWAVNYQTQVTTRIRPIHQTFNIKVVCQKYKCFLIILKAAGLSLIV